MPVDKPRVVAGLRPVGRDVYDFKAAAGLPSATGGAPSQSAAAAIAGATGTELTPGIDGMPNAPVYTQEQQLQQQADVQAIKSMVANNRIRYQPTGILSQLPPLNRSIQEYVVNNQGIVDATKAYLDQMQANGRDVLGGVFTDTEEMAQWAVAHVMRSWEPGPAPSVPDLVHQSRQGRRIMRFTDAIRGVRNAGA